MRTIRIASIEDERLAWYRGVKDPLLLREGGRFVAEGRSAVARLLASPGWHVESVLVSPAALQAIEPVLAARVDDVPVFVADLDWLVGLAGYNVHRGCLAIGFRPPRSPVEDVIPPAGCQARVLALERLADPDNVGACFRNAAAFGADAVLLDEASADPLYRKAIRTSVGATLQVPFARVSAWPDGFRLLSRPGTTVVGLTPAAHADPIDAVSGMVRSATRVVLLVGSEGHGLQRDTLAACDVVARIPMAPGVDSLNVATAAAIALFALTQPRP